MELTYIDHIWKHLRSATLGCKGIYKKTLTNAINELQECQLNNDHIINDGDKFEFLSGPLPTSP